MTVEELIAHIRTLPESDLDRLREAIEGPSEAASPSKASDWAPLFGCIERDQAEGILQAIRDDLLRLGQHSRQA